MARSKRASEKQKENNVMENVGNDTQVVNVELVNDENLDDVSDVVPQNIDESVLLAQDNDYSESADLNSTDTVCAENISEGESVETCVGKDEPCEAAIKPEFIEDTFTPAVFTGEGEYYDPSKPNTYVAQCPPKVENKYENAYVAQKLC